MFCYIFVLINIYNSNIKTVSNIVNKNIVMRGDFNFHFDSNLKLKGQKQPPEVFFKKKVFLEISQNSKENTCARVSFLIKLQALQLYQKRDSGTGVFLWVLWPILRKISLAKRTEIIKTFDLCDTWLYTKRFRFWQNQTQV